LTNAELNEGLTKYMPLNKSIDKIFLRYGLSGGISAIVNYIVFVACLSVGTYYLLAATLAAISAIVVSYFLHRNITFRMSDAANMKEFAYFLMPIAINYPLGMIGYFVLIGIFRLDASLAFVLNNVVMIGISFALHNVITFKRRFGT